MINMHCRTKGSWKRYIAWSERYSNFKNTLMEDSLMFPLNLKLVCRPHLEK